MIAQSHTATQSVDAEFEERIGAVAGYDRKTAEKCARSLLAAGGAESDDAEILESLTMLGVAHPKLAERLGFSPVPAGRRLAACLERAGTGERARSVLELLAARFPDHRGVDRDLAAVMRRQGSTEELIQRRLDRAQGYLDEGDSEEAIACLREVLQLDRSRKDVARLIRDLRYEDEDERRRARRRARLAFVTLALSALITVVGVREVSLRREFAGLPTAGMDDLDELRMRGLAVEEFVVAHPVWHGAFASRRELTRVRARLTELEARALEAQERHDRDLRSRLRNAEGARERGDALANAGDLDGALEALHEAQRLAPEDWDQLAQVVSDIAAIEQHLAATQPAVGESR